MNAHIHEQVRMQLQHLKQLVDAEAEEAAFCQQRQIPYTPSNRAVINRANYEEYLHEIQTNGDKNLLVRVRAIKDSNSDTTPCIRVFAKRYVQPVHNSYALIHRLSNGTEILINSDDVII